MRARVSSLLLLGLLPLVSMGCGDGDGAERFALYHLETAIGPPGTAGELRCGQSAPAFSHSTPLATCTTTC